jgi:phage/plasmid primase-like uncharacterized protein
MVVAVVVATANSNNSKATENIHNRVTVNSKDILSSNSTVKDLAMVALNSPAMTTEITPTANSKADNTEGKTPIQVAREDPGDQEALTASVA